MFWQAAEADSNQLPVPATLNPTDPGVNRAHILRSYPLPTSNPSTLAVVPDRVTLRIRLQPIGLDVLDLLATPNQDDPTAPLDLDPAVIARMPTFSVLRPTKGDSMVDYLEWNPTDAVPQPSRDPLVARSCVMVGSVNLNSDWYPATLHQNDACRP